MTYAKDHGRSSPPSPSEGKLAADTSMDRLNEKVYR